MGLRCSVLGHRYGERERIEERDDRGDEVITTVREVKTCERCSDELVVTESKEVTVAEPPEPTTPEPSEPEPEPTEIEPEPMETTPPDHSPEEDDGIILPDESDEERGQWPADPTIEDDPEEAGEAEPAEVETDEETEVWPSTDGEDEGFDAMTAEEDDDVGDQIIEAVQSDTVAPQGEDTESGFFRATTIGDPATPSSDEVNTEYYCPRCDWSAKSLGTSVRRGDICPSCRLGYVAERDLA